MPYLKNLVIILFLLPLLNLSADSELTSFLYDQYKVINQNYTSEGLVPSNITFTENDNGSFTEHIESSAYRIVLNISSQFLMTSSYTEYLDSKSIDGSGLQELQLNQVSSERYTIRALNKRGRWKDQEKNMGAVMDHALIPFYLQARMIENPQLSEIFLEVYNPYIQKDYEIHYVKKSFSGEQIINEYNKYDFPEDLVNLLNPEQNYLIWEGQLTGIASTVFPHKFHLIQDSDNLYRMLLEWGGNPSDPYYAIAQYP